MGTDARAKAAAVRDINEQRCRRLLAKSELLTYDDLDWAGIGDHPIDAGVLETLVYMRDVEGFTSSYLVGIGAHRTTLRDPIVARFLDAWKAEETVHSEAIDRFLKVYGTATGTEIPPQATAPESRTTRFERLVGHLGGPVGQLVAAAHMTWGAANELLTMSGYRMLADRCGHPTLAELLRRIAAQESRHYSFYLLQAEWRLERSRLARMVIARIMHRSWTPVGIGDGYKTCDEFEQVLRVLTGSPGSEKLIDRMDRRFSQLPGLEHLRIYRAATTVPL